MECRNADSAFSEIDHRERLARYLRHSLTAGMECRRRLSFGITTLDAVVGGGIARGRVSEIIGRPGVGRTSLAVSCAAVATRSGEVAAWIDSANAFDPHSLAAAGADLSRILWVGADSAAGERGRGAVSNAFKAAEMVLSAGGFSLVMIDLASETSGRSVAVGTECQMLRLARAAERSGAAMLVMAAHRTCGTFAALSLVLGDARPSFSRTAPGAPTLFDGIRVEAHVARNKLGGSGQTAVWRAMADPLCAAAAQKIQRASGTGTRHNERLAVNAA